MSVAGVDIVLLPFWAVTLNVVPDLMALMRRRGLLAIPVLIMVPASLIFAINAMLNVPVNTVATFAIVNDCWGASILKRATRLLVSVLSIAIIGQVLQLVL